MPILDSSTTTVDTHASDRAISMTKPSILYSSLRSPHSLKAAMFLSEKGIEFERVEVDLPKKEQKLPQYLRIHPMGQVPCYIDDYGSHPDSLFLMHYLEGRYPNPPLFPTDDNDLPLALDWIARSSREYRNVSHELYWQLLEPPQDGTDWDKVNTLMAQGHSILNDLEITLQDKEYILGNFGVVDIAFIPWINGYQRFEGLLTEEKHPSTVAWVQRVTARQSFKDNYQMRGKPLLDTLK